MELEAVTKRLESRVRAEFSTQKECADYFGVTTEHIRRILTKGHPPTKNMLEYLGLEKRITYHKKQGK